MEAFYTSDDMEGRACLLAARDGRPSRSVRFFETCRTIGLSTAGYLYNDGAWPWTKQLRGCLLHCAPIIHFLPKGPPPDADRLIQAISLISSRSFLGPFPRLIGLRNVF